jgi:cation diffusion facilitator CzcD-associated flavoprotein CzcO
MEINPRLSASVEVAVRAGVPFPRLLYAWASGAPLTRVAGYRLGVRLRWLGGELDWLHHAFARPGEPDVPRAGAAVCGFAADFLRPSGYDYLDRRDPGPALRAVRTALRDARRDRASRVGRSRTGGLDTDVAVIGAGPYGLSLSAHLAGRRVRHELFGQPMGLWRRSMPEGMQLKSEGFASNLSDPLGLHTLQRFCSEHDIDYAPLGVPVRLDTFVRYGDWFRERAVPALRPEQVELVSRVSRGFHLRLDTGDELRARRVVDATGPHRFAHVPEALRRLRSGLVLHSCEVRDPAALAGARVAVVGAGQSALEAATLVREHGGSAIVVARTRRLAWGVRPRGAARTRRARVRDPLSGLGEGLWLTAYANHPLAFHALPSRQRLQVAYRALGPAGAWWLRPRFDPSVDTLLGRSIVSAHEDGGGVRMCLNGGAPASELVVDRVIAATGFRPDPERLGLLLDQATRAALVCDGGMPVLDGWFESSVRGLHFAGYAAAPSFGPVMRFVFGADFAARRLTRRLAPQRAGAVARTASAGPRSASR